jgi:hypothetical protein
LKALAIQVMELLHQRIGPTNYSQALNQLRTHVQDKRYLKRQRLAEQAITNPEAFAQRKIGANERKRASQKRKTAERAATKVRTRLSKKLKQ